MVKNLGGYSCFIVNISPVMKNWFSGLGNLAGRCKDLFFNWVSAELGGFKSGILFDVIQKVAFSLLTFIFALGKFPYFCIVSVR